MKSLLASLLVFVCSISAFAHTTTALKIATNANVEALRNVSSKMAIEMEKRYEHSGGGTVFNDYKITKLSPTRKSGESEGDFAERLLKSLLHRDYPITGDDGGYGLNQIRFSSEAVALKYIQKSMAWISDSEEAAPFLRDFVKLVAKVSQEPNVVVLEGDGSGNNTMAYIFAVIDLKNNELFYMIDSNFGSDD